MMSSPRGRTPAPKAPSVAESCTLNASTERHRSTDRPAREPLPDDEDDNKIPLPRLPKVRSPSPLILIG